MDEPATKTPSPDEGEESKPAHSYRWLILVGALFVVAIKVVRCAKHEGEPAARDRVTAQDSDKQAAEGSPLDCSNACKKDCFGSSDPLAHEACLRNCDEHCGIGGEEDGAPAPRVSASALASASASAPTPASVSASALASGSGLASASASAH